MKAALAYLVEGLWLMRRSPGLFVALITLNACFSHYGGHSAGWMILSIGFSFLYYYWTMTLTVQVMNGAGGHPLQFLKLENAPLIAMIIYPIFAMLWATLVSLPLWILGSMAGGVILGQGMSNDPEAAAKMITSSPQFLWMISGMLTFTFVFYCRFLSNRITVPITAALKGIEMGEADRLVGPQSKRRFPPLFWVFALPMVPAWTFSLFIFTIVGENSALLLIFDLVLAFVTAWPIVAAVAFVQRDALAPMRPTGGTGGPFST